MKTLSILSICLVFVIFSCGVCFAAEQSASVSYLPSYEELAPTELRVIVTAETKRFGTIYHENQALKVGETVYKIRHQETKEFRIRPKIGYEINKIIYDKEDITDKLRLEKTIKKDYILVVEGRGHDASLEITFKDPSLDDPNNPGNPGTGDTTDIYKYIVILVISIIGFVTTLFRKRRIEEQNYRRNKQ